MNFFAVKQKRFGKQICKNQENQEDKFYEDNHGLLESSRLDHRREGV